EVERDGRLVDIDSRKRLAAFIGHDGVSDEDLGQSREHDHVSGYRFLHLLPLDAFECEELADPAFESSSVLLLYENILAVFEHSFVDSGDSHAPEEVVI